MKLSDLKKLAQTHPGIQAYNPEVLNRILQEMGMDPNHFYQEIEMSGRFVDTHQDTTYVSGSVGLHSHNFMEILYCRNSCGVEYLVGADRYRLQKGDIVMVAPGVSHQPILPAQLAVPYRRYVIWISKEFINRVLELFPDYRSLLTSGTNLIRTAGTQWEYLGDFFRRGVEEAERRELFWEASVMGNTELLVSHLFRAVSSDGTAVLKAEEPELSDRITGFIETNLSQKITLADAAKFFFVSESTVSQTFRKKMGVSFYRFVTQRRLIAAKTYILEGVPLEAISERVGFTDYSAFYRAFKQEFGISPRQFRQAAEKRTP